ncbi:Tetratricopeptide repeat protein [Shimia sp. SK013]|uniref:tetratricopeptide repeat protein n=1 Tax=Shimia sp. SK013 TaxID=1389006 RepID=UPI0006B4627C|nr:tetratricopeptide repeat protein [Shimia sp. SK013]KPA23128.1 Tetratricopeptide repeat protein [Shimia sp. SK013]
MKHLVLFLFLAPPVWAETQGCPVAPDHTGSVAELLLRVQKAKDETSAKIISNELWEFYADAPDAAAQEILDRGMRKRAAWDLLGAREDFDALVEYCPDYAEGYNQRAFVNFLRSDFQSALPDLERAIVLSPQHVAAMSGRALTLIGLGRKDEAQEALAEALALNPWLPERSLLQTPEPDQEL